MGILRGKLDKSARHPTHDRGIVVKQQPRIFGTCSKALDTSLRENLNLRFDWNTQLREDRSEISGVAFELQSDVTGVDLSFQPCNGIIRCTNRVFNRGVIRAERIDCLGSQKWRSTPGTLPILLRQSACTAASRDSCRPTISSSHNDRNRFVDRSANLVMADRRAGGTPSIVP